MPMVGKKLTGLTVEGFKPFGAKQGLQIRPLALLAGANRQDPSGIGEQGPCYVWGDQLGYILKAILQPAWRPGNEVRKPGATVRSPRLARGNYHADPISTCWWDGTGIPSVRMSCWFHRPCLAACSLGLITSPPKDRMTPVEHSYRPPPAANLPPRIPCAWKPWNVPFTKLEIRNAVGIDAGGYTGPVFLYGTL